MFTCANVKFKFTITNDHLSSVTAARKFNSITLLLAISSYRVGRLMICRNPDNFNGIWMYHLITC